MTTILVEGCEACRIYPMHSSACTATDKRWGGRCNRPANWAASANWVVCRWHKHTYKHTGTTLVKIKQP